MYAFLIVFVGSLILLDPALALDVALHVQNREPVALEQAPVRSGLPFARGALNDAGHVRLLREGVELPAQFLTTARWPDGSVRWLLMDFQVDLPASGEVAVQLRTDGAAQAFPGVIVEDGAQSLSVDTRAAVFLFSKAELALRGFRFLASKDGRSYVATPDPDGWSVEEAGPVKAVIRIEGSWREEAGPLALEEGIRFRARLVFDLHHAEAHASLTLRNTHGFGWDPDHPRGSALQIQGASFGVELLPAEGAYVFGQGAEKTWELKVPASGLPQILDSRYTAGGALAPGFSEPGPLAVAEPAYYASTRAWGPIVAPISGAEPEAQADFDRFEKIQRAKVLASELEDPPNLTGITLWGHLAPDLGSWNDYGDLRWGGNGCGTLSGNHYDWSWGLYLQFLRTGRLAFADAARVLARHEIDWDIYHTGADGPAYNFQKNWEDRPSHDSPDNCFGGGRPTHTWMQGYAMHWLLTGDRRGLDAVEELREGLRQYVYESFNGEGYLDTSEIRLQGWVVENLITLWRLDPSASLDTSQYGAKSLPRAIQDVLRSVFDREAAAGGQGFVHFGDPPDPHQRVPLMNCYFLEPAIHAYDEIFQAEDPEYAQQLLGLILRMTQWLMSVTYGGDTLDGLYRPLQIPYFIDTTQPELSEGQIPYLLMAANAASFCFLTTGEAAYQDYARRAFRDCVRYMGVAGPDSYIDPALRTPASYNSAIFVDTESKLHGWSSRYGQFYLSAEQRPTTASSPGGLAYAILWGTILGLGRPWAWKKKGS